MAEEALTMTVRETDRLSVVRQTIEGKLTWVEAAERLRISERQVGRLCAQVRAEGSRGVIHGLRGTKSNRRLSDELMSQALGAVHDPVWDGFGPTFARDKLAAIYGLRIGLETLRKAMMASGAWVVRRQGPRHRAWRERRACVGMLVQMDGSDHDWLEGRGPRCVLLMLIDDASGLIQYAEFVDSEDTHNVMRAVKAYVERYGRPVAFYVDKDSIFRVAKHDESSGEDRPATQFGRAMEELGVEVIWAHSPQAKGRVERSFKTHQDRLVKELRLAGICTMSAANTFLQQTYVPNHNARYAVAPAEGQDAHRALLAGQRLDEILSLRWDRVVQNDYTVRFETLFLQLLPEQGSRLRPKERVEVEKRLDGILRVRYRGGYVRFKQLDHKPYTPYYAYRRPEFERWPTKGEAERATGTGSRDWLWAWKGKGMKQYFQEDNVERPSTAFI